MSSFLHKNWLQTEATAHSRMQMLSRTTASSKMSPSCGQRGRGQTAGGVACIALLVLLMFVPEFIVALKDVSVIIPQAVKQGSNALFTCNYDMENDTLYSVKWYKGKREFYRYTPKENPAMKVFPMTSGLNVERTLSNQSHVVLQSVPLNISGKFTCEISVEAPTFQTAMVSGEMEVVELPKENIVATGLHPRYRVGDLVDGNCSIKYSKPAANLTWTINGIVVPQHHIKPKEIEKQENSTLVKVTSALSIMLTPQHFVNGQMKIKCKATIYDILNQEIETVIDEIRPMIMASGRSHEINQYPPENGERERGYEDHNESYLTYHSPDDGASCATKTAHQIFWRVWLLKLLDALPLEQTTKLCRHINRQLLQWAWHLDAWLSYVAVGVGAGMASVMSAVAMPLWLWGAHQIINYCQYGSSSSGSNKTAQQQQQQQQQLTGVGVGDACSDDCDVNVATMSKAASRSTSTSTTTSTSATSRGDKCFYNCQTALATLTACQSVGNSNLDQDSVQQDDDDDEHKDDDAKGKRNGEGIGTGNGNGNGNAGDDLTVRRHQQLSATLQLNQRLLMTLLQQEKEEVEQEEEEDLEQLVAPAKRSSSSSSAAVVC